ncbi:hypothetical protein I312_101278 [Cryptococcus bacillisporus CA1280]|uniref:uncharacterized protein n=1 Tax=Cryptococcus bacillisporus CA1280 TaxID=1296109 RepID=UPI0033680111
MLFQSSCQSSTDLEIRTEISKGQIVRLSLATDSITQGRQGDLEGLVQKGLASTGPQKPPPSLVIDEAKDKKQKSLKKNKAKSVQEGSDKRRS